MENAPASEVFSAGNELNFAPENAVYDNKKPMPIVFHLEQNLNWGESITSVDWRILSWMLRNTNMYFNSADLSSPFDSLNKDENKLNY